MKSYLEFISEALSDQGHHYYLSHNTEQHHVSPEYNKPVTYNKSTHSSPSMNHATASYHDSLTHRGYKLQSSHSNASGDTVHLYTHSNKPAVTTKEHASGGSSWMVHDGHGGGFNQRTHQQVHSTPHTSSYSSKSSLHYAVDNHKANSLTHDDIRHGDIHITSHPHLL